ncbi:MAG: hypothetical protein HN909_09450 [Phycisphaerales bacterium]|jgi:putative aminopeptidase FrvX|nr:hypothetical protein [Phycisphaerales bacterium]MBT7171975.1 hypothetical protein [Phycisphaerales bacterium]
MELLRRILSQPTAPFCEQRVAAEVTAWATEQGFVVEADAFGNLSISYQRGRRSTEWVVHAHLDHPGFVVRRRQGRRAWCEFRGGVQKDYFVGARVRFFAGEDVVRGTVQTVRRDKASGFLHCRVELDAPASLSAGDFGVWDVTAFCKRGKYIDALACDDLACVAATLSMLERLAADKIDAHATVWLTRAEEVGFGGLLAAIRAGTLNPDAWYIGLETSKAMGPAQLGAGVAIRVGDRLMGFDPALGFALAQTAGTLAKADSTFHFSRALMDGGGTETTALVAAGYRAAALALPLGNYHNMGSRETIAPERIALGDYHAMIRLLVAAVSGDSPLAATQNLQKRFAQGEKSLRAYWKQSPICLQ